MTPFVGLACESVVAGEHSSSGCRLRTSPRSCSPSRRTGRVFSANHGVVPVTSRSPAAARSGSGGAVAAETKSHRKWVRTPGSRVAALAERLAEGQVRSGRE